MLGTEQGFRNVYYMLLYPVVCAVSCFSLDGSAEIFWGQAEQVGIKFHIAVLLVVLDDGFIES